MGLAGPGSHWVGGGVGGGRRACSGEETTLDRSQWAAVRGGPRLCPWPRL